MIPVHNSRWDCRAGGYTHRFEVHGRYPDLRGKIRSLQYIDNNREVKKENGRPLNCLEAGTVKGKELREKARKGISLHDAEELGGCNVLKHCEELFEEGKGDPLSQLLLSQAGRGLRTDYWSSPCGTFGNPAKNAVGNL